MSPLNRWNWVKLDEHPRKNQVDKAFLRHCKKKKALTCVEGGKTVDTDPEDHDEEIWTSNEANEISNNVNSQTCQHLNFEKLCSNTKHWFRLQRTKSFKMNTFWLLSSQFKWHPPCNLSINKFYEYKAMEFCNRKPGDVRSCGYRWEKLEVVKSRHYATRKRCGCNCWVETTRGTYFINQWKTSIFDSCVSIFSVFARFTWHEQWKCSGWSCFVQRSIWMLECDFTTPVRNEWLTLLIVVVSNCDFISHVP
jgi:hypothetical protein